MSLFDIGIALVCLSALGAFAFFTIEIRKRRLSSSFNAYKAAAFAISKVDNRKSLIQLRELVDQRLGEASQGEFSAGGATV